MTRFELGASVVLWRESEILVMKRGAASFASGGWFIPGGHVEESERPTEACARELFEETGITIAPDSLRLIDVMTYAVGDGRTAHVIIYAGECPPGAECVINDEHVAVRWMQPEAYITRFLDPDMLLGRGIPEAAIGLAREVTRVVRSAAGARGGEKA